jgi:hypothetical protein
MTDHHERIRVRAFHLWEQAGKPEHRDHEFWMAAEREMTAEASPNRHGDETPPPARKKTPKAAAPLAPPAQAPVAPPAQAPVAPPAQAEIAAIAPAEKPKKPKHATSGKAKAAAHQPDVPAAAPQAASAAAKPAAKKKPKK